MNAQRMVGALALALGTLGLFLGGPPAGSLPSRLAPGRRQVRAGFAHAGKSARRKRIRLGSGTARRSTSSPSQSAERRARAATVARRICW